jgi:transposase-like protein
MRVVVLQFCPELARSGADDGIPGRAAELRNDPSLVRYVWRLLCGQKLKRRRPKLGDKWFLDEVFLKINGVQHYLWRAVDQRGVVIDILVQPKRDRFPAIRFCRKLLQTSRCPPRVIITDKLHSYAAAKKIVLPRVVHRQSRYLNNRARKRHLLSATNYQAERQSRLEPWGELKAA